MHLHHKTQETLFRKIERWKNELKGHILSNTTPITNITCRETREYETYEQALSATDYAPVSVGDSPQVRSDVSVSIDLLFRKVY